jgi:glucan phosphoethanolaminetransferase (alkaline phosphatase superfamily)
VADEEAKSKASTQSAPRARLRRIRARRLRRLLIPLVAGGATLWIVGTDLAHRASSIRGFDRPHRAAYAGSVAESIVFWSVLLVAASRRRATRLRAFSTALFFVVFTLAIGVEGAFRAFYNIYLSIDGQLHSKSIPWSIVGTLPISRPVIVVHLMLAAGLAVGLIVAARKVIRARFLGALVATLLTPGVLYAVTQIPVSYRTYQSTTFDMIYFHGLTALVRERLGYTHDSPDLRVQKRDPMDVPKLTAEPKRKRNVMLILQESQRFDVTCNEYDPNCQLSTRFSNKAVPDRYPLNQLRSNASTTAISISNIWSGVRPHESRDLLHSVPLLWEYANAAGYDTAYWTSQNLMFGNARLFVQDIPASHFAVATHVDAESDLDAGAYDRLITDRAIAQWGELKEPFFAVVHYSNVHFPYVYDEENAPFQPASMDKSPEKNEEFKNYYRDVVYLSDIAVGRLLSHIRSTDSGKRTVVIYTSDHGESFREHWQLGHTSSTYDEEVHVPGWVDAPAGTLAPEEEASLKALKDTPVWHLDLAPTFLDLLGLWDEPKMAPFRARMMGHPLTRPERTLEPVPMTNCTWVWECAFRNWGMMQGSRKLEAREWDGEFHCFDVLKDPDETNNLGERACAPMPDLARELFHVMPDVTPPDRTPVDWGKK